MDKETYTYISKKITELKKKYKKVISNIVYDKMREMEIDKEICCEKGFVLVTKDEFVSRVLFCATDIETLQWLLKQIPNGHMIEYLYKEKYDLADCLSQAGFTKFATYIRRTEVYEKNPYKIPEIGKRKILEKRYDPSCGEYAQKEDIPELIKLHEEIFCVYGDDFFTYEQWEKIIENRECLVYKVNGIIMSYFVWKIQGKKFYTNIIVNRMPANISYNMERRIREEAWDSGIHCFYNWIEEKNVASITRRNDNPEYEKNIIRQDILYNDIWIKKKGDD